MDDSVPKILKSLFKFSGYLFFRQVGVLIFGEIVCEVFFD